MKFVVQNIVFIALGFEFLLIALNYKGKKKFQGTLFYKLYVMNSYW